MRLGLIEGEKGSAMNCQDVQKFAFTYLDAEFDARERGEFEEHLRLCCGCRTQVSRDAMMKDLVARHLHASPCQGADQRLQVEQLRARVCQGMERSQRRQIQTSIGVSVAALAVMAVAVGQVLPGDHGHRGEDGLAHGDHLPGTQAEAGPLLAKASGSLHQAAATSPGSPVALPSRPTALPGTPAQIADQKANWPGVIPQTLPGQAATPQPTGRPQLRADSLALQDSGLRQAADRGAWMQPVSARMGRGSLEDRGGEAGGEVLAGVLSPGAMTQRSPFGAVRSEESLRQMVQLHLADLPPEIAGSAARVQRYLQLRVPGAAALPLAEGAGVRLRGARIGVMGGQTVVIYNYTAYGSPLTVVSRSRAQALEADVEQLGPDQRGPSGLVLDHRAGLQMLHVIAHEQMLTLVGDLPAPAMLQLLPAGSLL